MRADQNLFIQRKIQITAAKCRVKTTLSLLFPVAVSCQDPGPHLVQGVVECERRCPKEETKHPTNVPRQAAKVVQQIFVADGPDIVKQ